MNVELTSFALLPRGYVGYGLSTLKALSSIFSPNKPYFPMYSLWKKAICFYKRTLEASF